MRPGTLLVSGTWQRPESRREDGVIEHLQHRLWKTERHQPHSEEGGGGVDGHANYFVRIAQVNAFSNDTAQSGYPPCLY